MKKLIATLLALILALSLTLAATAEEPAVPTFTNGVQFNMDMDQVMKLLNLPNPDIDKELTRGPVAFEELEYEKVLDESFNCDLSFKFVDNKLVAIHKDMADGTAYEAVKAALVTAFGAEAVPFDPAVIGNGKYAVDDDGDLKDAREMIVTDGVIIVLEQDHEGDVDVTILDPAAGYIAK